MNIIVTSQYFYPDSFRINDIVQELVEKGNKVKVITGLPDYTNGKIPKEYKWFRKRHEIINGAEVVRVPTIARRKGIIFRVLNYISFVISSFIYTAFCNKKDIDAIFSYETSPVFQVIPAIKMSRRTKKPLIIYCCDLWPESLKAWGVKENNLIFKIVKLISIKIYNKADKVAITSKPFENYLSNVCRVPLHKMEYLPQHCNDEYESIVSKYQENDCIDFMFAGNVGAVQNIECILYAIKQIKTDKEFCVHIVGDGSELDTLKKMAKQLDVDKYVYFHGRQSSCDMTKYYHMADCTLLTLRGGDFIGKTLPSKCQTYLSLGKPVIGAIDGAGFDVINDVNCGKCARADDYEGLAAIMLDVIDNFESYKIKGLNGRKYYEESFTKEKFITDFLNIIEPLCTSETNCNIDAINALQQ